MSRSHLYNILRDLDVSPAGANQRPQRYPVGTAAKILAHLGFSTSTPIPAQAGKSTKPKRPSKGPKLLTMEQLRAERENANHGRGSK
jgi:hypothetical protein